MPVTDRPEANYTVTGPELDADSLLSFKTTLLRLNLQLVADEEARPRLLPPTAFSEIGPDTHWLVLEHFSDFRETIAPTFSVKVMSSAFKSLIETRSPKEVAKGSKWDLAVRRWVDPVPIHEHLLVIARREDAGITPYRSRNGQTSLLSQYAIGAGGIPVFAKVQTVVNRPNEYKSFLAEFFSYVNDKIRNPQL